MEWKISIIQGQPVWDALPVGKIIYYPMEKRDYRPFAQARLCVNRTHFFLRLWAFETHPSDQSVLMARLNFDPERSGKFLELTADSRGGLDCTVRDGADKTPLAAYGVLPQMHSYWGEDLEGEYWGVMICLPRDAIRAVYGEDPIRPGYVMRGNLYKQDNAQATRHLGSLFPIDLEREDPFGPASFQPMEFVPY